MTSREEQIAELRAAIAAQEAMRATLGDATVELSLKPLRSLLNSLLAEQAAQTSDAGREGLLAQLESYIPKQLADKIRASGHVEGERRQVTVVFADVSGFTALSETLDPEDVAAAINDCLKELADAVYQYEGMVDSFIGDCVMAVFGAPIALEDDAERALRAALSMRERLEPFNRRWIDKLKEPLALHIGINSGTVIAGSVGNDLRMRYAVMGDTVNVASRLQGVAQRGQIFVSQNTYRLTRGAFTFRALEPVQVKGKSESLAVYELLGAKIQPEKTRGLEGLVSPLVGRSEECNTLCECISQVKRGQSTIAMIFGDAGVGKSRLLSEVRAIESEGVTWLEGRCFAYSQNLSYGPFLDLLRRHLGIADEHGEEEQRIALRSYIETRFPADPDVYPVLAQLLALRLEPGEVELLKQLKGEAFRTRLFEIVEQLLILLSKTQPVIAVIEDLHWADQSSIDLLNQLLSITTRARVAIIVVSRSRTEPPRHWAKLAPALEANRENVTEIFLEPLTPEASRGLVRELLGGDYLPEKLGKEILAKAEGNPFFLEEVLRSLIERGILIRAEQGWNVSSLSETIRVPDTLQGVLLSRLDRLTEDLKRLIQKAAVIGRVFLYRVLQEMAREERFLHAKLDSLEASNLVHERSRLPELEYIFKHALTQEVAYQTLLAPARKVLHQKVGEAMESIFATRIEEFRGLLAYHYFCAEAWEKALEYAIRSADGAFRVSAYPEARLHYRRSLECLEHLEEHSEHQQRYVDLTIKLVGASLQSESPEKNLSRLLQAETVARSLDDPVRLARLQLWIGRAHYYAARLPEAIGYFRNVLTLAPNLGDPELLALPQAVIGRVLVVQGHFAKGLDLLNQAIPLLGAAKNWHELLYAYIYRGCCRSYLGDYFTGLSDLNGALAIAQTSHDQNAEAMAQTGLAFIQLVAGRYAEAIQSAQRSLRAGEKSDDPMFRYTANSLIAWGLSGLSNYQESLKHWAAAHEAAAMLGGRLLIGELLAAVEAESLLGAGDAAAAIKKAEEALALARSANSILSEGLAKRAIGRALATKRESLNEAAAYLAESFQLLETTGAKYDLVQVTLAYAKVQSEIKDQAGAIKSLETALALSHECNFEAEEALSRAMLGALAAS